MRLHDPVPADKAALTMIGVLVVLFVVFLELASR